MSAYSAHADLCAAVHENEDVEMLVDMHEIFPDLCAYPISGDMLAVVRRGTRAAVQRRRKRATAERTVSEWRAS
ncbi:MAG: hypothetical protein QM606_05810 [Leucobacter sp.]